MRGNARFLGGRDGDGAPFALDGQVTSLPRVLSAGQMQTYDVHVEGLNFGLTNFDNMPRAMITVEVKIAIDAEAAVRHPQALPAVDPSTARHRRGPSQRRGRGSKV